MKGLKLEGKVSGINTKDFYWKGEKETALEIKISDIKIDEILCVLFDDMAGTAREHIQKGDTIQVVGDIIKTDLGTHILRAKVLVLLATAEEENDE